MGKPEPSYASHVNTGMQMRRTLVLSLFVANLVRCLSVVAVLSMTNDNSQDWLPGGWDDKRRDWLRDIVALFPTLVFLSALSVVVMFWAQLHYTTTMVPLPMLQCVLICLNVGCYILVATVAVCTYLLKAYEQLSTYMICIVGFLDLVVAISFLYYGIMVMSELGEAAKKRLPEKKLTTRVKILTLVCPLVISIRGCCFLAWGLGLCKPTWLVDLVLCIAGEWVPSVVLLLVLGPVKPSQPRSPLVAVSDSTDSDVPLLQDEAQNSRSGLLASGGSGYTWKQLYPESEKP